MADARVAILLCTYNGEQHLQEQLDSIAQQGLRYIDIWVSDDGSTDGTIELLEKIKKTWVKGRFIIKRGPQQGFAANFLSLVCDQQIHADYYAYSDQDDLWGLDKLTRAHNYLSDCQPEQAALYCSRTTLISESGKLLGKDSVLFTKSPSFRNALVQSIAGGNTMVFNQATKNILQQAGMVQIVSHDWWTYMLVMGTGGKIMYDPVPAIRYRQHVDNEMGSNTTWAARVNRLSLLLLGRFREWNDINISALKMNRHMLTEESQRVLDIFCRLRGAGLSRRLKLAKQAGLYRQTLPGNIALIGATLLKKL